MRLFLRWAIACAFLAPLFCSAAAAQDRTPGFVGEVRCVMGEASITAPRDELVGLARAENIRHEAVHYSQFAHDCNRTLHTWAVDPAARLEMEAEATCTGLRVYRDPTTRRQRKGVAITILSRLYGNAVGFEDIYAAFDRYCEKGG